MLKYPEQNIYIVISVIAENIFKWESDYIAPLISSANYKTLIDKHEKHKVTLRMQIRHQ